MISLTAGWLHIVMLQCVLFNGASLLLDDPASVIAAKLGEAHAGPMLINACMHRDHTQQDLPLYTHLHALRRA